jgi:DNA-binding CsgD family transcriptional regulator
LEDTLLHLTMEVHMSERGRPKKPLILSGQERETLERWARRTKSPQSLALRSKIVLACAAPGVTNQCIAASLRVHQMTVGKWRSRFIAKRLELKNPSSGSS